MCTYELFIEESIQRFLVLFYICRRFNHSDLTIPQSRVFIKIQNSSVLYQYVIKYVFTSITRLPAHLWKDVLVTSIVPRLRFFSTLRLAGLFREGEGPSPSKTGTSSRFLALGAQSFSETASTVITSRSITRKIYPSPPSCRKIGTRTLRPLLTDCAP